MSLTALASRRASCLVLRHALRAPDPQRRPRGRVASTAFVRAAAIVAWTYVDCAPCNVAQPCRPAPATFYANSVNSKTFKFDEKSHNFYKIGAARLIELAAPLPRGPAVRPVSNKDNILLYLIIN